MSSVFDSRVCTLGEGPLWHPERAQFFWFDIVEKRLLTQKDGVQGAWQFDEHYSAAGWVDETTLILASEAGLWQFDIATGAQKLLVALEADNPITRSNDGRADPWGGFWIGTMGKNAEAAAGAIYRYFKGELRKVVPNVQISNAICFDRKRSCAYYTDTLTRLVLRQGVDALTGWPSGAPEVFVDLNAADKNPDGAVVDADGNVWIALWGSGCVNAYAPDGSFLRSVDVPGAQSTCPAFGGADLRDMFVTSASADLAADVLAKTPENGMTFVISDVAQGVAEPRVIL